jgi:hypothetical protein
MTDEKIAAVICYLDETETAPADYVVELRPGLYEARVYDEFGCWSGYERVLGIFVNFRAACTAIHHSEREWWTDGWEFHG